VFFADQPGNSLGAQVLAMCEVNLFLARVADGGEAGDGGGGGNNDTAAPLLAR
jgi:hypothetical protein